MVLPSFSLVCCFLLVTNLSFYQIHSSGLHGLGKVEDFMVFVFFFLG